MAAYTPQVHLRQVPIELDKAALLYIDTQNYNGHPDGAEYKHLKPSAAEVNPP